MMRRRSLECRAAMAVFLLALAGCQVGPNYVTPSAPISAAYKEPTGWTVSKPQDDLPKGAWWSVFRDPPLSRLEPMVQVQNQTVLADLAAYRQAEALIAEARSSLFPTVLANGSLTRSKLSAGGAPSTGATDQLQASWAPDIWGKISRTTASDVAAAQASAADLQNATLSLQGALAADYFELRYSDSLDALLTDTIDEYKRDLVITQNQYNAGVAPRSDVLTAQTQVLTAQAQAINVGVARSQYEHAIAVLTGRPPADLSLGRGRLTAAFPKVPVGLPSTLLQRRPDIAAAERRMKEENELIGVAIAGYFPSFTLSSLAGFAGDPFSAAASASSLVWSVGAAGSQTLFNGFLTSAQVDAAKAAYDQSVATYRQTVLTALQQVEDELSTLRILAHEAQVEDAAVHVARQAVEIAINEYKAGTQPYTVVVTAEAASLADEESALSIRNQRAQATVALIEALGGGWNIADLPAD